MRWAESGQAPSRCARAELERLLQHRFDSGQVLLGDAAQDPSEDALVDRDDLRDAHGARVAQPAPSATGGADSRQDQGFGSIGADC